MSSDILQILKGIDKTNIESEDGWWETSDGARFGVGKLDAVISRFKKLETQRNELLEALEQAVETTYSDKLHEEWRALIAKAKGE